MATNPPSSQADNSMPQSEAPSGNGHSTVAPIATAENKVALAKLKGYEGDPCPTCGHLTLVRNGTCMRCDTCGSTTGCS